MPQSDQSAHPSGAKKAKKWPWIVATAIALLAVISIASNGSTDEPKAATVPTPTADTSRSTATETTSITSASAPATSSTIPPLTAAPKTSKGKTIQYEVISDSASLNSVTWFDENSSIQQKQNASTPWSLTVENPSTVVIAGVGAQTTGTSVTCRVIVDGKVKDEQTATGKYAVVNCNAGF